MHLVIADYKVELTDFCNIDDVLKLQRIQVSNIKYEFFLFRHEYQLFLAQNSFQ